MCQVFQSPELQGCCQGTCVALSSSNTSALFLTLTPQIVSTQTPNGSRPKPHYYYNSDPQKCSDLVSQHTVLSLSVSDHQPNTTRDDAQQAQQQLYDDQGNPTQPDNQGSFGHEVLAAGAGFMAMRQYQKHEEANGSSTHPYLSFYCNTTLLTIPLHQFVITCA